MSDKKKAVTKTDLVKSLVESKKYANKKEASKAIDAVFGCLDLNLKEGNKIALIGFGNFEIKDRPARDGRNPATGEPMKIKASKTIRFKAGKALKEAVNQ